MRESLLTSLVEEAILAPSVHNVQPSRWRIEANSVVLVEDMTRRLLIGDPRRNDVEMSLGAAFEGLRIAASRHGFGVQADIASLPELPDPLRAVMRCHLQKGGVRDPFADQVFHRSSWRGPFAPPSDQDRQQAQGLASSDAEIITDPAALKLIAPFYDKASYGFMRDHSFRGELLGWMRLRRSHPKWSLDGLNAEAMALGRWEAIVANIVLGPAFRLLSGIGLAPMLLAEGSKIEGAAAVSLFHRPKEEAPFESGRHFYRHWLGIEAKGFSAQVLAALADDEKVARELSLSYGIASNRRIVSAFRIGQRRERQPVPRARLPLDDVLV